MRRMLAFSLLLFVLITPLVHANKVSSANVERFLQRINLSDYQLDKKIQRTYWACKAERAVEFPESVMEQFFLAAAHDQLTVIRLFGVLAEFLHQNRVALCGSGEALNRVIERNRIYLGLSLPLNNLAVYTWLPQYDRKEPDRLMHLSLVYRSQFMHRFEEQVLSADLKMGFDSPIEYQIDGQSVTGYLTEMDLYVSPNRISFDQLRGIGVRPHGFLGKVLDFLAFLPDTVYSMYLQDNVLATEALITTRLPNFETTRLYQIQVMGARRPSTRSKNL